MEKLIVLGNGFDLALGLRSKYSDFYYLDVKPRIDSGKDYSFWELILSGDLDNWRDIEKFIEKYLLELHEKDFLDKKVGDIKREEFMEVESHVGIENNLELVDICLKTYSGVPYINFLQSELAKLEDNFSLFLELYKTFQKDIFCDNNSTKDKSSYDQKASELLSHLNDSDDYKETYILNFNYTTLNLPKLSQENIFNIHGTLMDGNPIIGTDLTLMNKNNAFIPFTKPFRILKNKNLDMTQFHNMKEIIFWGHSLGDTDFSYFKSLFDIVDLYDGNVCLTFYIAIYDMNGRDTIINNSISNIIYFLNKYSKMLTGVKDEDVSLFTKLLFEGRLKIETIQTWGLTYDESVEEEKKKIDTKQQLYYQIKDLENKKMKLKPK